MRLPDGFTPVTFAEFDAAYPQMVREVACAIPPATPTVSEQVVSDLRDALRGMSDGCPEGWRLLQFARSADGQPAAFAAAPSLFDHFERVTGTSAKAGRKVADATVAWFDSTGDFDAATGRVVDEAHPVARGYEPIPLAQWSADSQVDFGRMAAAARLSRRVAAEHMARWDRNGWLRIERAVSRSPGLPDTVRLVVPDATVLSRSERALAQAMGTEFPTETFGRVDLAGRPAWPAVAGADALEEVRQVRKQMQLIQTPEGPLAVIRQVAERLLAEGVVTGALDGALRSGSAAAVKAAIMASAVCDFCSAPGAAHFYDVPDFGVTLGNAASYSDTRFTGGWAACDACAELIAHVLASETEAQRAARKRRLEDRCVTNMAFPKFSRQALSELHAKFWEGMAERQEADGTARLVADFVEDRMRDVPVPADVRGEGMRGARLRMICDTAGLTRAEAEALVAGEAPGREAVAKLAAFKRRYLAQADTAAGILRALDPSAPRPHRTPVVPHWQVALDEKLRAASRLGGLMREGASVVLLGLGFEEDVRFFRAADAYSFSGETIAAILEAAASVPADTPLSGIETPNTGAGWFWFGEPLPVTCNPAASDRTHALLWGWSAGAVLTFDEEFLRRYDPSVRERLRRLVPADGRIGESDLAGLQDVLTEMRLKREEFDACCRRDDSHASVAFSAYVRDESGDPKTRGHVLPSTRWSWPFHLTLTEMLAEQGASWDRAYGPGSPHAGIPRLVGRAETLRAVEALSRFFVMACLWFRQTVPGQPKRKAEPVLTRGDGAIERHARKRMQREHGLAEPPRVQVVALRRSARAEADGESVPPERREGARNYQCRWIVKGHLRLQACGPGRKDRKLIWIDAYPAGPDDKPLKTREKVYAVVR